MHSADTWIRACDNELRKLNTDRQGDVTIVKGPKRGGASTLLCRSTDGDGMHGHERHHGLARITASRPCASNGVPSPTAPHPNGKPCAGDDPGRTMDPTRGRNDRRGRRGAPHHEKPRW